MLVMGMGTGWCLGWLLPVEAGRRLSKSQKVPCTENAACRREKCQKQSATYLEAQLGRPGQADPARLARYTGTAREELARLGRLAEDLLAVARVEPGPLPLRMADLDLAALARAVAARF